MPNEGGPKIPRIPWKGSRLSERANASNDSAVDEILQGDRARAEKIVERLDYAAQVSALKLAHDIVASESPESIVARFRSLPVPDDNVVYTEQQYSYALAFLMITD